MGFEEYIIRLQQHISDKYQVTKMEDDKYSGLHIRFKLGCEVILTNGRLLSYFDKFKDQGITIEDSFRNITDTIESMISVQFMDANKIAKIKK